MNSGSRFVADRGIEVARVLRIVAENSSAHCPRTPQVKDLFILRLVRALLRACVMYATLAAAQEEWPRNDLATLDDRVPDSPLTNSLAQQIPPSSQVAVQPD